MSTTDKEEKEKPTDGIGESKNNRNENENENENEKEKGKGEKEKSEQKQNQNNGDGGEEERIEKLELDDHGEILDEAFEQIKMCDEEDDSFSRSIVTKYFEQAEETIPKLFLLYKKREMKNLSETGHFLKSSSAVLGIRKVKDSCEKIQHYGSLKDLNGKPIPEKEAVALLKIVFQHLDARYQEAKNYFLKLYP